MNKIYAPLKTWKNKKQFHNAEIAFAILYPTICAFIIGFLIGRFLR